MQGVREALALGCGKGGQALEKRGKAGEKLHGLGVFLHRHEADGAGAHRVKPRLRTGGGSLMERFSGARGVVAGVSRSGREMLVQQNAGEQADERRLVRNVFQIEAVGHPTLAGDVVEPRQSPDRADGGELGEQVVVRPQPADEFVGLLAVVDAGRAVAALDGGHDPAAEFLACEAVDDGAG